MDFPELNVGTDQSPEKDEDKMDRIDSRDLRQRIAGFPRIRLIHLPTPLRRLENLTRALGGPEIWIKRDDLTGQAFGGNKSRKLEFIIPDALAQGADTIITWASLQSNWCMQTAAAARRFGLRPVLILFKTTKIDPEYDGNLLLDYILGADIRIREAEKGKLVSEELVRKAIDEIASELRSQGHKPYIVSVGGSAPGWSMAKPLGAISYVAAFAELAEQAEAEGTPFTHVIHATGSGATQAGLAVGSKALAKGMQVMGISVSDEKEAFARVVLEIAQETERILGLGPSVGMDDIIVFDEYIKDGYGVVNAEVAELIRLLFIKEGIVLDPVYTGKAMAALADLVKKGFFQKNDRIVFFHTGGTPALFPYRKALVELLK
jgi:D-cysteine desulfhydrase family pyridoxal phosphate-dependent enzyme